MGKLQKKSDSSADITRESHWSAVEKIKPEKSSAVSEREREKEREPLECGVLCCRSREEDRMISTLETTY